MSKFHADSVPHKSPSDDSKDRGLSVCKRWQNNYIQTLKIQSCSRPEMTFYGYSVQFSSLQSLVRLGCRVDMRDDSAEILFLSLSALGTCEQFWHGQGCPLFGVVHPSFPLPTTASTTLQGTLKDMGFFRCCRGVSHARTIQVSVSEQLQEEGPVDPQGR